MDKHEVHIFPPSFRPSSLCSLVFTFNLITLQSAQPSPPFSSLLPLSQSELLTPKGQKRRSLIVYYYRQHKHTQRRREKHSKEMLSLHTSSSPTLPFHHSTFQPKACVHAVSSSFLSHRNVKSLWASFGHSSFSSVTAKAASVEALPDNNFITGYHSLFFWGKRKRNGSIKANASTVSLHTAESDVLKALSQIIDPDFGTDIVSCGFVKDLLVNEAVGEVSFRLELTTPACPIKDMFEQKANEVVAALPWVRKVNVTMSAQPAKPMFAGALPMGLQTISNIIAVSSCKGGVGKSTVAVNLAFTLAGMGARVGLFDADVYGPSLPTMVSPENRLLEMNPEKNTIIPTDYLGVKLVSFGFAGQGRAIMRGPMVSGVINQLLTTTEWGELDYLVVDMPPGTGDIQLTLCQVVPLTAAVIVTTPQKLAFIDVAKGVRMFSKLKVPCIAVVENMCHFDADGKRYYPFGRGSGSQLSASGDSGVPEVVADPQGEIASTFQDLGVCVVQQCAKIRQQVSTAVTYDRTIKVIKVKVPASDEEFYLHPATVRRNDQSAQSVDEWTGEQKLQYTDIPEDIEPEEIRPMGNYAVSITWPDGFSQIAPYDQLQEMERLVDVPQLTPA
ncbi:fe-S cluster assembly factor HCF101, chloroplastic isoform X2 [Coffea arabica]|uniref:Fe-S cluster assembly factor HCF101, chloroplastic isoform X2 n=1 Tax=Coffea arabica TaxID=13443 RepID=A0ABM4UUL1_COFAR